MTDEKTGLKKLRGLLQVTLTKNQNFVHYPTQVS